MTSLIWLDLREKLFLGSEPSLGKVLRSPVRRPHLKPISRLRGQGPGIWKASDVSAEPTREARTCTPEWKVDVFSPLRVLLSLQRRSPRAEPVRLEDGWLYGH
jgi:hypothetical protein